MTLQTMLMIVCEQNSDAVLCAPHHSMISDLRGSVSSVISAWQATSTKAFRRLRQRWAAAARLLTITDLLSTA